MLSRVLSGIFYQFPPCIDRYIDLMNEIYDFHEKSRQNGLSHIIAVGTFEIGMEFFLLLLANNFNRKIYMPPDRREFLRRMESGEDSETIVQKLLKEVVEKPSEALIHVVDVDEISQEVGLLKLINSTAFECILLIYLFFSIANI